MMENLNRISLTKCTSYSQSDVSAAIEKAFSYFGGIEGIIKKGSKVLLKPNLLKESDIGQCVITHPHVIEAIAKKVLEAGATPIIGDSPAFGAVKKIAKRAGLDVIAKRLGIEIIELDAPRRVTANCGGKEHSLTISGKALDADAIINIPKLKAHTQLLYTAGVKNMYGCVSGKRKMWRHLKSHDNLEWYADMLIANLCLAKPAFTIVDAVMAMEKSGPTGGLPRKTSLIIGGIDAIAVDRVIAELLYVKPENVPILRAAKRMNIGEQELSNMEIVGEELASAKISNFLLPELTSISFNLLKAIKSLIKHLWLKYASRVEPQA